MTACYRVIARMPNLHEIFKAVLARRILSALSSRPAHSGNDAFTSFIVLCVTHQELPMSDGRQSSKATPREESGKHAALTVTGRVTQESGAAISGLLAEAIDVRARDQRVRLASASVNAGNFSIAIPLDSSPAKNQINLQLRLYAPDRPGTDRKERLLFESETREGAAATEHFE